MKKIIPYIAIELLFFIGMFTVKNDDMMVLCFVMLIAVPIFLLIKKIFAKLQIKPDFSTNTWVSTKPIERPKTYTEYLWLMDTEDIGNKFFRAFREDLEETDEYHMTKKEILDEYFDGDKIYKYEPYSLPFKVEDGKVYSYIEEDKWIYVGSIKRKEIAKYEQSTKTDLQLMPNYFKKVNDETIESDHGDAYFGLEVTLPIEQ